MIRSKYFYLLSAATLLFVGPSSCDAFTTIVKPPDVFSSGKTTVTTKALKASPLDDELQDLDQAREHFEHLMQSDAGFQQQQQRLAHAKEEYTPRPLTESSRRRRMVEMELLESLQDSDEAIEELMSLWMVERGRDAATQLREMESSCSPGLVEEEQTLQRLTKEYPHWAEPFSRLASLLYFKGRTQESEDWCQVALAVKPWHFEVAHTRVLNALRNEDMAAAIRFQRDALPPLNSKNNHKARKAWVKRALEDAQESLEKAQAAAVEKNTSDNALQTGEIWQ